MFLSKNLESHHELQYVLSEISHVEFSWVIGESPRRSLLTINCCLWKCFDDWLRNIIAGRLADGNCWITFTRTEQFPSSLPVPDFYLWIFLLCSSASLTLTTEWRQLSKAKVSFQFRFSLDLDRKSRLTSGTRQAEWLESPARDDWNYVTSSRVIGGLINSYGLTSSSNMLHC